MADEDPERPAESSTGQRAQTGILIYLPNRLLLGLCALQFALLMALVLMNWGPWPAPRRPAKAERQIAAPSLPSADAREPFFKGNPGPWGDLEYVRINIEPPDRFLQEEGVSSEKTRWFFADYTRPQLTALFNTADLTAAQRAELLDPACWQQVTNGIVVTPGEKLILEMNPQARSQIYSVLAEHPRNDYQFWPCVCRNGGFADWFQQSGLSEGTLALVKSLVYQRGTTLCFSDVPEVLSKIPSAAERRRLTKTLARNSTVLMKLRVKPDTDINALISYWAKGGRAKDIEPLLESLSMVPGSVTIDIVHLLPPFARKRLNTYPPPDTTGPALDCYWSAMNFFNDQPDDRYLDPAVWQEELRRDYTVVTNPVYGDLVFLVRTDGAPMHAAVYIADDVVFTKNGSNYRQPWMLVRMEDLLPRYLQTFPVRVAFFHSNKRGD